MENRYSTDPSHLDVSELKRMMEERKKARSKGTGSSSQTPTKGSPFNAEQDAEMQKKFWAAFGDGSPMPTTAHEHEESSSPLPDSEPTDMPEPPDDVPIPPPDFYFGANGTAEAAGEMPEGSFRDKFGWTHNSDGSVVGFPNGCYVDERGEIRNPDGSHFHTELDGNDMPESFAAEAPDFDDYAEDDELEMEFDPPVFTEEPTTGYQEQQKPRPNPDKTVEELKRELEEYKRLNAELQKQMMTAQQFARQAAQEYADVRKRTMETEQPQERCTFEEHTAEFNGQPFKYVNYEERFTKKPSDVSNVTKENAFVKLSALLIDDIIKKFGGLASITDVAVISDMLLLNSVRYAPVIPEEWLQYLPISERNAIAAGHLAKLFDFGLLFDGNMPNVMNILVDSESFAFTYVRPTRVRNLSEKTYFEKIPSLVTLQIGSSVYTRDCLQKPSKAFVVQQRAEEIRKGIDSKLCSFTFNRWDDFWDIVKDSDRGGWERAGLGALNLVGAAAGGAGVVATKGAGLLGKAASGIGSFFKTIKENM